GYRLAPQDVELWEQLLSRRELCAYAYNAILKIDPNHARLLDHLIELWRKRVNGGWEVNAVLLTARTIRARGESESVFTKLDELQRRDFVTFKRIVEESA